ncbi:MAG: aspartyl protease family protein [Halioglobus sp.]
MARFVYDNAVSSYSWTSPQQQTTVPFTLIDNHIILPVQVNGSETMSFVLDSGAGATVVMDSRKTRSLALQSSSQITVSGVGTGPDPVANIVRDTRLTLGSLQLEGQSVVHLPIDSVPFFIDLDDVYFDGVIGAPFFSRFTVAIDYDLMQVTFSEPATAQDDETLASDWHSIPLEIQGGVPYLAAELTNTDGELVAVRLLADTGARGAVLLSHGTHQGLPLPTAYFETMSQGLSGDIAGRMTMSDSLVLGNYPLEVLPVDYALAGGEDESNSNGLVGNEVLRRFNLIFDYHNERLLLSPNQLFTEPMFADRSGLQIRPHQLGGIIRQIAPGSGASDSGLQVGDIITTFNTTPVSMHTIGELKRALASDAASIELCWHSDLRSECADLTLASRFRNHEST